MLIFGLVDVPLWLILTLAIVITLYMLGTRNFDYFKKRGIPGPKPWPFIGTFYKFFSPGVYDMHQEAKQKYGKIIGNFMGNTPSYVIFDEEMLSQITVKQFQNFTDRRSQKMGNEAFDCMLTLLKGDHWRHVRSQMSPAFTTGKLRMMSNEINRSSRTLAKCLIAKKEPFEARALASRYTMDVIASTGFGLRVNSQEDEDNAFLKNAKKIMNFSLRNPKVVILFICPWLIPYLNKLGFSIFNDDATDFFVNVVDQSLAGRAEGNEKRGDFLQLMVKASQGQDIRDVDEEKETEDKEKVVSRNTGMTKNEILGNALIFFLAGYDTTSAALSYLMYLLSCNQDCQQKLIEEIDSVVGDKDDIDYDTAMKMPYLDQCLQESLRIYPPGIIVDRTAVVDTEVCGIKIEKGMTVVIPIMAIHRDPEIWPEPMKFDPERFTPENKANMNPFHWMPFGYGPRNCIAMRLALYEIKIAIATILRTHKIVTCEKTQIPLKLSKSKLAHSEKGIWLSVEKRTEE